MGQDSDLCKRDDGLLELTPACAARGIMFVEMDEHDEPEPEALGSGRSTYAEQASRTDDDAPSNPGSAQSAGSFLDRLSTDAPSADPGSPRRSSTLLLQQGYVNFVNGGASGRCGSSGRSGSSAGSSGRSTYLGQESRMGSEAPSDPGSSRGSSLLDRLSERVSRASEPMERD